MYAWASRQGHLKYAFWEPPLAAAEIY